MVITILSGVNNYLTILPQKGVSNSIDGGLEEEQLFIEKEFTPKTSGYWFNFSFIHIDGNWTTAASYDWCSGNGSWGNPYIIENMSIDVGGAEYGILINNSKNDYFIIRNCSIYNSGSGAFDYAGIKIKNTNNGTIMNNNVSNNERNGIFVREGRNNTILSNNASYNYVGIMLNLYSNNNTILQNNLNNNNWGIELDESTNNTLSGNNASYNNFGIGVYSNSNNNTLSRNKCSHNTKGAYLFNSRYNIFSGSNFSENYIGIQINTGSFNTIKNNLFRSNDDVGVLVESGDNNTFHGNYFINNTFIGLRLSSGSNIIYNNSFDNIINVKNDGINNNWSYNFLGNSWNDYSGKDANDDGIGDTPYNILGSSGGQDDYPFFWDSPVIMILAPMSDQKIEETSPNFNISIIEGIANATWYSIYDGNEWSANYTTAGLSGQINQTLWDTLPDGTFTIRFYTNDSRGYLGFSDIQVMKLVPSDPIVIPPDLTLFFILIIILISLASLAIILSVVYTKKSKKKIKERESEFMKLKKIKSELTEEDFLISKERRICLVHKGIIEGLNFVCPSCGALYCVKCYDAVKDLENACWSCSNSLDPQKPVKKLKKTEEISISDEDVKSQDIKHKGKNNLNK
jgi:parallel beta-helix repeat protein